MYSYCMFMYLHRASWHSSATLTEVFPCFFLSCKANARVKPTKTGNGPHSFKILMLFYVFLFCVVLCIVCVCVCVCKCVLYCCHRVATHLQLTNISCHIVWAFLENIPRKFTFHQNLRRIRDTWHVDLRMCTIISRWFFLEFVMFQTKAEAHILCSITLSENRVVYEPMWKKYWAAGQTTGENKIGGMRFARSTNTSTNTHPEYAAPIAFPLSNGCVNPSQYYVHCPSGIHLSLRNSCWQE